MTSNDMTKQTNAPIRVLIVDDEKNVATMLAAGLKKLGQDYIIDTADSGASALAQLQQINYSLVITDYRMPGMNGVRLAQEIRQSFPDTHIILMTAFGTAGLHDVVGSLKLDGYLDKPIKIEKIREVVKAAVGRTYQGEDSFRAGKTQLQPTVHQHLDELQVNANARCVLLLSTGGYPIEMAGQTSHLDVASISALVAANFMAAAELAQLLGNNSVFKSSYHEGPDYDIYAHDVNGDCLLTVIFGSESKTGIVRHYTNKTLEIITPLLDYLKDESVISDQELGAAIDNELEQLFG